MSKVLWAVLLTGALCPQLCVARAQSSDAHVVGPAEHVSPDKPNKKDNKKNEPTNDSKTKKNEQKIPPVVPATVSSNTDTSADNKTPQNRSDAPQKSNPTSPSSSVHGTAPPSPNSASSQMVKSKVVATAPPTISASPALSPTAFYRVGVGDVLDIRLINGVGHDSTLYTVTAGGLLDYPLAGDPFNVSGLTTEEIGARLSAELKRRAVYDRPQFNISVRDYASHTVMVSGLIDQPGVKILRREAVPLYVVLAEALPRADAGRVILISHTTNSSKTIDLSDPSAMNELVYAGDVVNVQSKLPEYFYIGGMIGSPGQKDFHNGLTLTQALLASGGVSVNAGKKVRVTILRQGADGRLITTDYLLKEIKAGEIPDPRLQPGDRIEVGRKH